MHYVLQLNILQLVGATGPTMAHARSRSTEIGSHSSHRFRMTMTWPRACSYRPQSSIGTPVGTTSDVYERSFGGTVDGAIPICCGEARERDPGVDP